MHAQIALLYSTFIETPLEYHPLVAFTSSTMFVSIGRCLQVVRPCRVQEEAAEATWQASAHLSPKHQSYCEDSGRLPGAKAEGCNWRLSRCLPGVKALNKRLYSASRQASAAPWLLSYNAEHGTNSGLFDGVPNCPVCCGVIHLVCSARLHACHKVQKPD